MSAERRPSALRHAFRVGFQLFYATFRMQQRQAVLGRLWLFLPAAGAAVAAGYVQRRGLLNVATPGLPYPVFVFAGTVLWQAFVDALNTPLSQIASNRLLVTRMRVPHAGLMLVGVWTIALNAAIRMAALVIVCRLAGVTLAWSALLLPAGVAVLLLLGLAIGLLIAPFGLLYDDVRRGVALTTTFLIFVMPIGYPIAATGWQRLNPILPIMTTTRDWLTHPAPLAPLGFGLAGGGVLLVLAWSFYRLARPHVVARLG